MQTGVGQMMHQQLCPAVRVRGRLGLRVRFRVRVRARVGFRV